MPKRISRSAATRIHGQAHGRVATFIVEGFTANDFALIAHSVGWKPARRKVQPQMHADEPSGTIRQQHISSHHVERDPGRDSFHLRASACICG
jgi:hypothetical protein